MLQCLFCHRVHRRTCTSVIPTHIHTLMTFAQTRVRSELLGGEAAAEEEESGAAASL